MKIIDIINHILNTVDNSVLTSYGVKKIDDISDITNECYSGEGFSIEFITRDVFANEKHHVVFDSNGEYLGTRTIDWFNDVKRGE